MATKEACIADRGFAMITRNDGETGDDQYDEDDDEEETEEDDDAAAAAATADSAGDALELPRRFGLFGDDTEPLR